MKTLRDLIREGQFLREAKSRVANWSENHVNNIVNNLVQHTSMDAVEVMGQWDTATTCAQLFDTYVSLLDDFPWFAEREYSISQGAFPSTDEQSKHKKDKIEFYVLESQKRLRGITYRDE